MAGSTTVSGQWRLGRKLGSGGFGTVQVWIHADTGRKLAVKKCKWEESQLTTVQKDRWSYEVLIMKRLNHPNIVKTETLPPELATSGNNLPVLCMEYCRGGDLRSVLTKTENCCGLEEGEALKVISHVISAVEYLHCHNITHRDLKPENIVVQIVNNTLLYKLIDLGYAKELGEASTTASIVGTLNYVAPELLWKETYSCSVDYWSLGILFYEVLTGIRPFLPRMQHTMSWMQYVKSKDYDDIYAYESEGKVIFGKDIRGPTHLSKCLQDKLVEWFRVVLQWDPKQRGRVKKEDGTLDLVVFKLLRSILSKRIVYVFCTRAYTLTSYEVDQSTSVQDLQQLIGKNVQIPIDQQTLTDYYGTIIPTSNTSILSQIHHPVLFIFKSGSTLYENMSAPHIPTNVQKMMEQPRTHVDPGTLKDYYCAAIFFMKREKNLFDLYIFGLSIKVDLVNKKINAFNENMENALRHTDALVKELHVVQQFTKEGVSKKRREAFEHMQKKISTLSTAAEQIKMKLRSLMEAYSELRNTAEHNDFGSDLSEPYNDSSSLYESFKKDSPHKSAQPIMMVKQVFKFLKIREALLRGNNNIADIARKADGLEDDLTKLEGSFESVIAMTTIYANELRDVGRSDETLMQQECSTSQHSSFASVSELMETDDDSNNVIYDNILIRHALDNLLAEMQRNYMKMLSLDTE